MILSRVIASALIAGSAVVLTPGQASAANWVANSCVVQKALSARLGSTPQGDYYAWIPCGTGLSGVTSVHAWPYPMWVNPEGPAAPFCLRAGYKYTPNRAGAVVSPTVRC